MYKLFCLLKLYLRYWLLGEKMVGMAVSEVNLFCVVEEKHSYYTTNGMEIIVYRYGK